MTDWLAWIPSRREHRQRAVSLAFTVFSLSSIAIKSVCKNACGNSHHYTIYNTWEAIVNMVAGDLILQNLWKSFISLFVSCRATQLMHESFSLNLRHDERIFVFWTKFCKWVHSVAIYYQLLTYNLHTRYIVFNNLGSYLTKTNGKYIKYYFVSVCITLWTAWIVPDFNVKNLARL